MDSKTFILFLLTGRTYLSLVGAFIITR